MFKLLDINIDKICTYIIVYKKTLFFIYFSRTFFKKSGLAPWASQPFSAEAHTTLCSIRFTPKDNFPFKDSFPFTSLAVLWSVGRVLKENPHNTGRICKLVHAKHP